MIRILLYHIHIYKYIYSYYYYTISYCQRSGVELRAYHTKWHKKRANVFLFYYYILLLLLLYIYKFIYSYRYAFRSFIRFSRVFGVYIFLNACKILLLLLLLLTNEIDVIIKIEHLVLFECENHICTQSLAGTSKIALPSLL